MCRYPLVILLFDAPLAQYASQLSQRAVGSPLAIPAAVVAPVAPQWLPTPREISARQPEYSRSRLRAYQQRTAHAFLPRFAWSLVFKTIKLHLLAVAVAQATPFLSQFRTKRLFKHDVCVSMRRKAGCLTCWIKNAATKVPAGVRLCCYKVKCITCAVIKRNQSAFWEEIQSIYPWLALVIRLNMLTCHPIILAHD